MSTEPAAETPDRPAWLTPGAEVLLYNAVRPGHSASHLVSTTVATVGNMYFTVAAAGEPRFRNRLCFAQVGGTSSTWGVTRCVAPLDSDEARDLLREAAAQRRKAHARAAVHTWVRSGNRENRLAAITALQALEQDEAKA